MTSLVSRGLVRGPGLAVLGVGALVFDEPGLVEVQHAGDGFVEQVQVVADHQQGAAVGPQESHEPVLGIAVEVIGGLIEQQHVTAGEEDAGQLHAAPLSSRQRRDGPVDAIGAEAQAGDQLAHLGLGGVAAERRKGILGAGEAGDGAFRRVLLHGDTQLLEVVGGLVEPAPRQNVGQAGAGGGMPGGSRILTEEPQAALGRHPARGRRQLAAQDLQQAGLARTVAANEADLVAGAHREGGLLQGDAASYFDAELANVQHPTMMAELARPAEPITERAVE